MVVNIEKRADPTKAERLKASKKAWNATVGLLRVKLKAFRNAINGHGDPDAQLPEVDLKDPFPVEFHTYLASIVDDYDKVIKGADFIMDLQDDFSVTRRKSRKELREVAAEIDNQDQLMAEASWWGSRAWAWFALHKLGKEARRVRLRMLSIARKSVHALNTIEYNFTSSSPGSDVRAIVGLTKFINLYIGGYLTRLSQLQQIDEKGLEEAESPQLPAGKPKGKPETGEPDVGEPGDDIVSGAPPDAGPDIESLKAQVHAGLQARNNAIQNSSLTTKEKLNIDGLYKRLAAGEGDKNKPASDEDWLDVYKLFMKHLEAAESKVSNAQTEEEEYRKIAQNVLQRWWSRKKLEWRPTTTDELKLRISDKLLEAIGKFRELMDVIESLERSTGDIADKTSEVSEALKAAADLTLVLADDYRMAWKLEEDPKKRPAKLEESITNKLKKFMRML